MSDLLEPFRRAAELGCPDFLIGGEPACLVLFVWDDDYKDSHCPLPYSAVARPHRTARINRYAAAVGECWWREQIKKSWNDAIVANDPNHLISHQYQRKEMDRMIDLCREFARKHGGQ